MLGRAAGRVRLVAAPDEAVLLTTPRWRVVRAVEEPRELQPLIDDLVSKYIEAFGCLLSA